jgi:small subunit ribosomal protein S9
MSKKTTDLKYYQAIGGRKESVARVRLHLVTGKDKKIRLNEQEIKQGDIYINGKPYTEVYLKKDEQERLLFPFKLTNQQERFAVSVVTKGGGKEGQLGAIVHGLARALVLVNQEFKEILRKSNLLTRDPRMKERRKVGTGGKARRKKQSPKR